MKRIPYLTAAAAALISMTFTGCETPGQGAKIGAIGGAAIGAIAGGNIRTAAIGAGAGAAAGALVGKVRQEERRSQYPGYEEDRAYGRGYDVEIPVARRAGPGHVISPYKPYATVNVRGIRSGAQMVDPVTKRVFIVP